MREESKLIGNTVVFEIFLVVFTVNSGEGLHISQDVWSNIPECLVRNNLPTSIVEVWHVNCLALHNLTLHLHLMQDLLLKEVFRLDCLLFNGRIFHELFPNFIGGQGTSLMQEL